VSRLRSTIVIPLRLLKERWEDLRREQQEKRVMNEAQLKNIEVSKSAISLREETILLLKRQAMLDPISLTHK
jgi:hypothetical protein